MNHDPPNQWKPGQSGNPKGRPKKENSFRAIMERLLDKDYTKKQTIDEIESTVNLGNTKVVLIKALIEFALAGNMRAMDILLERMDGKVADQLQHDVTLNDIHKITINLAKVDE